jgi:hypothetical protein
MKSVVEADLRILVAGAGSIGGYFGGRLLEARKDVTFLVRPTRAAELSRTGLSIRSTFGDFALAKPPMVTAEALHDSYDSVLLSWLLVCRSDRARGRGQCRRQPPTKRPSHHHLVARTLYEECKLKSRTRAAKGRTPGNLNTTS